MMYEKKTVPVKHKKTYQESQGERLAFTDSSITVLGSLSQGPLPSKYETRLKGKRFNLLIQYYIPIKNGEQARILHKTKTHQNERWFRKIIPHTYKPPNENYMKSNYDSIFREALHSSSNTMKQLIDKNNIELTSEAKIDKLLEEMKKKYNALGNTMRKLQSNSMLRTQQINNSIANISKLLYYVQYLQNEIISRTYEGIFINTSLQYFRAGMAYNLKLKQMETLPQSEEKQAEQIKKKMEAKDMVYRKTILSKLIPGSTDHYCGHTYGDIPLSIHFNESKISSNTDIIHQLIKSSIPASDGGSPNELPKSIDINYCFMLVINNSNEANDPPRTAFIDTNILKREFNRFSTRKLSSNKNFLFLKWEMHPNVKEEFYKHSFIRDINIYRSKTVDISILKKYKTQIKKFGFGNGITKEITTSLLDDIGNIQEINSKGLTDEHDRNKVSTELNSLILKLDSLNAPSLIGTLVFADEMSKYSLSHYTCHHIIMQADRIKTQPYELYKILEEQTASNMALIKPLFGLNSTLIKKPIKPLNGTGQNVLRENYSVLGGKLLKNVSAKYKKTKRGKRLIKQSKKKNKNT